MGEAAGTGKGLAVLAAGLLVVAAARAEAPPQQEREPSPSQPIASFAVGRDVVLVDAVVTDGDGRPVKGLTAGDFVVREDGQPQALTSFEAVEVPPAGAAPPPPAAAARVSTNSQTGAPRVFVLVLDDAGLGMNGAATAREAARKFLAERTGPGDLVVAVLPATRVTWAARWPEGRSQLAAVVDSLKGLRAAAPELASDWEARQIAASGDPLAREQMRARLDAASLLPSVSQLPGESEQDFEIRRRNHQEAAVQAEARRQLEQDRQRRRRLFGAVSAALESVASAKGRKAVLLFTEGFIQEPDDDAFKDLVATLRRSNASIYALDVLRLVSGTSADMRRAGDSATGTRRPDPREFAGAEVLAEETGGLSLRNPNDLERGLARVAEEASSYYLLGYSPANPSQAGKYRQLQVEVRRAGLRVRARRGYYEPRSGAARGARKTAADPELERALASVVPETAVPLRLTAFAMQPVAKAKVRVWLVGEVALRALRFEKDAGGTPVATLDVALVLNHAEAAGRQRTPWREWKVSSPGAAEAAEGWVPLEASFDLPRGTCQARLVLRDRLSRTFGSVVHAFEVPDPGSWRVSTPILSDVPGEDGGPPRMQVGRSFVASSPLYCYLEAYDGAKAGSAAAARTSLAYALVDSRGNVRRSAPAAPLTLGPAGIPARAQAIPLSGLSPGEYELRLSVRNDATGRTQELREPFVLLRPVRPALATYLELLRAFQAGQLARAVAGVMEWRPRDLERLAASLPAEDVGQRRAAVLLHTRLALRFWSNARVTEAEAQIAIARAVVDEGVPADLHRDWLLAIGHSRLAAASPVTALPYFEECARLFPDSAEAWLGAGISYEVTAFPDGFAFAQLPAQDPARQAERCYREALRLDPRLAEARLRLGRVLALAKRQDEAERELSLAAEASEGGALTAFAHVFWGEVRDSRDDLEGAIAHYEKALLADGESQVSALALGEALHRSGGHRASAESLAAALATPRSTQVGPWHAYHVGSVRPRTWLQFPVQTESALASAPAEEAP